MTKEEKIIESDEKSSVLPELININDLIHDEILPEVNENAVRNFQIENETSLNNENIKLKKDGTPAKKRGRKPKNTDDILKNEEQAGSYYTASIISGTLENLSVALLSQDWKLSEPEKIANIKMWSDTLDYYGGLNLTPPQALILNHMQIILSRVTNSNETRSKLTLGFIWFKNKFSKIFKKSGKNGTLSNNRADDVRENDTSKKENKGS